MEPHAAEVIWSRSNEKHRLCYSTFISDGDSKAYRQVVSINPYQDVPIHKEECLAHVSKCMKKPPYVQHKLPEPKAQYVSSCYSTVILQHRGKSHAQMARGLAILFSHVSGDHTSCPEYSWCRWRTTQPTPEAVTNYSANDIAKVKEVFKIFALVDFCEHLTRATTQNTNETLHNMIWNFYPKEKCISPQSIRISTGIAVLCFNDTELCIFGLLSDLNLNPSHTSFGSLLSREHRRKLHQKSVLKKNADRRTRRHRTMREHRERDLLIAEGGRSHKPGSFGLVNQYTTKDG